MQWLTTQQCQAVHRMVSGSMFGGEGVVVFMLWHLTPDPHTPNPTGAPHSCAMLVPISPNSQPPPSLLLTLSPDSQTSSPASVPYSLPTLSPNPQAMLVHGSLRTPGTLL